MLRDPAITDDNLRLATPKGPCLPPAQAGRYFGSSIRKVLNPGGYTIPLGTVLASFLGEHHGTGSYRMRRGSLGYFPSGCSRPWYLSLKDLDHSFRMVLNPAGHHPVRGGARLFFGGTMNFATFSSFARDVSVSMAVELAVANGISPTQAQLWAGRV